MMTPEEEITQLRSEVSALQQTLWTLIAWTVQSANTPITVKEAELLRAMLFPPVMNDSLR